MTSSRSPGPTLSDGIITGSVGPRSRKCSKCGILGRGVIVDKVELPEGIKPSTHLIAFYSSPSNMVPHPVKFLGLTCGCYAKFHRQVSKIATLRSVGGK